MLLKNFSTVLEHEKGKQIVDSLIYKKMWSYIVINVAENFSKKYNIKSSSADEKKKSVPQAPTAFRNRKLQRFPDSIWQLFVSLSACARRAWCRLSRAPHSRARARLSRANVRRSRDPPFISRALMHSTLFSHLSRTLWHRHLASLPLCFSPEF